MLSLGRLIGDRYRLLGELGRSPMATTYRARDERHGRYAAVKLLERAGGDRSLARRFTREARRAAGVQHDNVVATFEVGSDAGQPYIAMELVDGGDLGERIRSGTPLDRVWVARAGAGVAAALAAAHAAGVVHGDLKPGNVLLTRAGEVRVADFGFGRVAGSGRPARDQAAPVAAYLSPEQARGDAATAASDVYALGAMLYELLTGQRPFAGTSASAIALQRLERPAPDPRDVVADLPSELASIVRRALALDPRHRLGSADELRTALTTWIDAEAAIDAAGTKVKRAARGARKRATKATPVAPKAPKKPKAKRTPRTTVAAPVVVTPLVEPDVREPAPTRLPPVATEPDRPSRGGAMALATLIALALVIAAVLIGTRMLSGGAGSYEPTASGRTIVVGEPGGEAFGAATPEEAVEATADPTPTATIAPTTAPPAQPTATPTEPPVVVAPQPQAAPPEPPPAGEVTVALDPAATVATWYGHVERQEFDAAYALWSERMKANFPRRGNLDDRWDTTAEITINQLYVAEQTPSTAKVQIDFIETYDTGSQARFIGWWDLVLVDEDWLLDQPHF